MSRKRSNSKKAFKEKMVANSTIVMGEDTPKKKEPEKVPEQVEVIPESSVVEDTATEIANDDTRRRVIIARFNFMKPLEDSDVESITRSLKRLEKKWEGSNLEIRKIDVKDLDNYDLSDINELPLRVDITIEEPEEEIIPEPPKPVYQTWAKGIKKGDKPFLAFEHSEPHEIEWKNREDVKYWPTIGIYSFGGAVLYKTEDEAKKGTW